MDFNLTITVVGSFAALIAVVLSMFFWIRSEANADRRHFQEITREDRKDMLGLIKSIELEMKDFHHRMLKIEEGRK